MRIKLNNALILLFIVTIAILGSSCSASKNEYESAAGKFLTAVYKEDVETVTKYILPDQELNDSNKADFEKELLDYKYSLEEKFGKNWMKDTILTSVESEDSAKIYIKNKDSKDTEGEYLFEITKSNGKYIFEL